MAANWKDMRVIFRNRKVSDVESLSAPVECLAASQMKRVEDSISMSIFRSVMRNSPVVLIVAGLLGVGTLAGADDNKKPRPPAPAKSESAARPASQPAGRPGGGAAMRGPSANRPATGGPAFNRPATGGPAGNRNKPAFGGLRQQTSRWWPCFQQANYRRTRWQSANLLAVPLATSQLSVDLLTTDQPLVALLLTGQLPEDPLAIDQTPVDHLPVIEVFIPARLERKGVRGRAQVRMALPVLVAARRSRVLLPGGAMSALPRMATRCAFAPTAG